MIFLISLLVIIIFFFCAILMAQEYTNYYPYYDPGYYSYSEWGWGYPQYGYGGYLGMPGLGLSSLYNPLSYYSYGSGYSAHSTIFIPSATHCLDLGCLPGA